MAKRGRKKGSKNRFKGLPDNFYFWRGILGEENHVNDFLTRGNSTQKGSMKHTLEYLRGNEPEYFEKINGEEILNSL